MIRWLSMRTAVGVAWFLIALGVVPFVCLLLWASTHSSQPISERIRLEPGQFVSSYFKPELDGTYQITLYWPKFPNPATEVNLDWRIVDSHNQVIDRGTYDSQLDGANIIQLGEYHPKRGVRQRIIVNVNQGVTGPDGEAKLEIGIPEVGLDRAEGAYPLAAGWAVITTVPGMIILVLIWFWRRASPKE